MEALISRDLVHLLDPFLTIQEAQRLRASCRVMHAAVKMCRRSLTITRHPPTYSSAGLAGLLRAMVPLTHMGASDTKTMRVAASVPVVCSSLCTTQGRPQDIETVVRGSSKILLELHAPTTAFDWPDAMPVLQHVVEHGTRDTTDRLVSLLNRGGAPMLMTLKLSTLSSAIHVPLPMMTELHLVGCTGRHLATSLSCLPSLRRLTLEEVSLEALEALAATTKPLRLLLTHLELWEVACTGAQDHDARGAEGLSAMICACPVLTFLSLPTLTQEMLDGLLTRLSATWVNPVLTSLCLGGVGGVIDGPRVAEVVSRVWPGLERASFGQDADLGDMAVPPVAVSVKSLELRGEWDWNELWLVDTPHLECLYFHIMQEDLFELVSVLLEQLPALVRLRTLFISAGVSLSADENVDDVDVNMPDVWGVITALNACPMLQKVEIPGYRDYEVELLQNNVATSVDFCSPALEEM